MPNGIIQSRQYREQRAEHKAQWQAANAACCICGQATIDWDGAPNEHNSFELQHIISRKKRPDLAMDPRNWGPSHLRCNRSAGAAGAKPAVGETTEEW